MSVEQTVAQVPRVLETPPRTTGDATQDLPLLIDWFWRAYQTIIQATEYVTQQVSVLTTALSNTQVDVSNLKTIIGFMIRGIVTVSGTNTGFSVTFTDNLPDNDYVVYVQAISSTGVPTAESFIISAKTYTASGFTVTMLLAPGAGTSVTYDWQLIRNTTGE